MDIIKRYLEITTKWSDIPLSFLQCGGFTIISNLYGRFFYLPDVTMSRINTWFIISSLPGITRRSTALAFTTKVINSALYKFYKEIGVDEKNIWKLINSQQIEDGSPEGIADAIQSGTKQGINDFLLTSTEFGGILQKMCGSNNPGYSKGVDILLSKLYYGESYNQRLSSRSNSPCRFIPQGTYVTMYSSMQEPQLYLNQAMNRQGLLRRIKINYVKNTDIDETNHKTPFQKGYSKVFDELEEFGDSLVPSMKACYKIRTDADMLQPITFNDESMDYLIKEEAERTHEVLHDPTDYHIYKQTEWEYMTKLACLDMISKNEGFCGAVTMDNINSIVPLLKNIDLNMEDVLNNLETIATVDKKDHTLNKVLRHIKESGINGILHSELCNKVPIKTDELDTEYIPKLLQNGLISLKSIERGRRWVYVDYK